MILIEIQEIFHSFKRQVTAYKQFQRKYKTKRNKLKLTNNFKGNTRQYLTPIITIAKDWWMCMTSMEGWIDENDDEDAQEPISLVPGNITS